MVNKNMNLMPSILDREVDSPEKDEFGHVHFSDAIKGLVESPKNVPPFSVGLLGKWGTGKSTIKELYLATLRDDLQKDAGNKTRSDKIHVVTFNAWRFGGDDVKRALLRQVFLSLDGDESVIEEALFKQIQRATPERRPWQDRFSDLWDRLAFNFIIVIAVFSLVIGSLWLIQNMFSVSNEAVKAGIVLIEALFGLAALRYLTDFKNLNVPMYNNINRIEFPRASAEQYEDLLVNQLKLYKSGKTESGRGKDCERLIIFVDDLDRLSAEEMIEGLDAIRTFMELPKERVTDGLGIVFVVSADETRIAKALATRTQPEMPGAIFSLIDARRYLDRIFQFRLEIPPFPRRDMRDYAIKRLKEEAPSVHEELERRDVAIEALVDRMIHVNVQSPRNALQILNAFVQSWWLALHREMEGAGTERRGGLYEGSVTNHPQSLAALSALRVDFPGFYSDLQEDPQLIQRFMDVFVRQFSAEGLSEITQSTLSKYGNLQSKVVEPEYKILSGNSWRAYRDTYGRLPYFRSCFFLKTPSRAAWAMDSWH